MKDSSRVCMNVATTASGVNPEETLSLKEMASLVKRFKAQHEPVYEACIMCERLYNKLIEWVAPVILSEHDNPYWLWGMAVYCVADTDAILIPELGLERICFGSRDDILEMRDYINLVKEKVDRASLIKVRKR